MTEQVPGYPVQGQDGYSAQPVHPPQSGHSAQPAGYPAPPAGYPAPPAGYPAQPGYPAAPAGDPAQAAGYPAQPGYPGPAAPQAQAPAPGYPGVDAYGQQAPQQPYAHQPGQLGQPAPAQTSPRTSPFAGIPASDYVMDGLAALLLLISLSLPWNMQNSATDRVEVILIAILSILSLSIHYLARFGAFPANWDQRMVRNLRAALNLPYILLVVVYMGLDVLTAFGLDKPSWVGLGGAAALGLAGAILAAVPRNAELASVEQEASTHRVGLAVVGGLLGVIAVTQILALVNFVKVAFDFDFGFLSVIIGLGSILLAAAASGIALVGVIRKDEGWRIVAGTIGIIAVLAFLFLYSDSNGYYNASQSTGGQGLALIFVPAAAALVLSPVISRAMTKRGGVETWFATAAHSWELTAGLAAALVVISIFNVINGLRSAGVIVLLVLTLIMGAAAVFAWLSLRRDIVSGRLFAIIASGAIILIGFIGVIVRAGSDTMSVSFYDLLLAFGLPVLALYALLVPPSVRAFNAENPTTSARPAQADFGAPAYPGYATGAPAHPGQPATQPPHAHVPVTAPDHSGVAGGFPPAQGGFPPAQGGFPPAQNAYPAPAQGAYPPAQAAYPPAQQVPVQSAPVDEAQVQAASVEPAPLESAPREAVPEQQPLVAAPGHGFTAAQASDPSTELAVLAEIAQAAPELRAEVAGNPATYPGLLDWLASLNDPAVTAALQARPDQH